MKRFFVWLFLAMGLLFAVPFISKAQTITQTVKGRIVDDISKTPLAGVFVEISFPDNLSRPSVIGDTDGEGYYIFKNIPVGKINVTYRCIGYESLSYQNQSLDAGKEKVINVELKEDIQTLSSAIVVAERDKLKPINEMSSSLSGRTFSVADAQRYAGAFNDPARMAQNFAGVVAPSDASNDIVIRGNSPFGLLWRLEGVDIFNPNHFSDGGATGGPISMINVNALSNSDFYTSAFPAEYVNAYSGVFDLKLREGNYDKREVTGQIGINGVELGLEGPLLKKNRASYLANYRYSFLDVLKAIGVGFGTGSAVPHYQDWTVKINVPTKNGGTFSLFSIGGFSTIEMENGESDFYNYADDLRNKGNMAVVGLKHQMSYNKNLSSEFSLAASTSLFYAEIDTLRAESITIKDRSQDARIERDFLTAQALLNIKVSPRLSLRTGLAGSLLGYKFISVDYADRVFPQNVNEQGFSFLANTYIEGNYRPTTWFTINAGVNGQFLFLNNSYSIDPRLSVTYKISPKHEINAGYGLHSQTQGLEIYLTKQWTQAVNDNIYPNKKYLKMTKAHHFVLGYQWKLSEVTRLKFETYYQYLFNIPVNIYKPYYSLVNLGGLDFDKYGQVYSSDGRGENIGIEITFERFLSKGWYYLNTISLFDSKFMGTDNVVRNTRYNGNYVLNVSGGKEFKITNVEAITKNKWLIGVDVKYVLAGGQRYIPVDVESSNISGKAIYMYDKAYDPQLPYYMRFDLKGWIKINRLKTTHEFGFEGRNITNRQNVHLYRYDFNAKGMVTTYQTGLLPLAYYRITF